MSTCPRCGKYLGERHACRVSWKRRWLTVLVMAIGAGAGLFASLLFFPETRSRLLAAPTLTVLGAVVAVAMWWSRPRGVD
jgi:O-antigen/teichoic acid export membrane protein